jgi:hypothetical protein
MGWFFEYISIQSNYLTKDFGEIYVHEGQILLIQTKKKCLKAF